MSEIERQRATWIKHVYLYESSSTGIGSIARHSKLSRCIAKDSIQIVFFRLWSATKSILLYLQYYSRPLGMCFFGVTPLINFIKKNYTFNLRKYLFPSAFLLNRMIFRFRSCYFQEMKSNLKCINSHDFINFDYFHLSK